MVETLLEKQAEWLSGEGPDADVAIHCRCQLFRNLADYPFPSNCTDEEKRAIEERVLGVLDGLNLLATGRYWAFTDLGERERRFLAERRVVNFDLVEAEGARGVYIADDQSFSISVNDSNHITYCGLVSGLQVQEAWSRMSLVDDMLAGALDFAFSERLGYLTSSISHVGTGLLTNAVLHLPALQLSNSIASIRDLAREKRHNLEAAITPQMVMRDNPLRPNGSAVGDLYALTNASTLGRSEEETVFHLKHLASELIERERESRQQILSDAPLQLEDQVGRALGLARGARLLAFHEANSVLSSLRLGVSSGLLGQFSLERINSVFVASQNAHIEMKCGRECDELTLSGERADLFRARFA